MRSKDDDRLPDVLRVCREALAREGAEREAYLDTACGGDSGLRRQVESLLAARPDAAAFLDSPPWSPATPLATGTLLGPYEIHSLIGEGGMGQVYRGRDTRLDRTVAVKVLPPGFDADPGRRARFEREAKTVAGLSHPHICTLYDVGDESGVTFLVMEHVEGRTLADLLGEGPLPVDEAMRVATQIAAALSAAHRQGVVHRDLKPANVMVAADGQVKVLDFGLAKPAAAHLAPRAEPPAGAGASDGGGLTGHGVMAGTVPYMSPEQVEGEPLDPRSDVFSFGAVTYELLTARQPFHGASTIDTLTAILRETPVPARRLRAGVPRALDAILVRCLAKPRDARYASAVELHEALVACQARLALRKRSARVLRQPRVAVPALALVAVLLGAASWSWWRSWRVNWARTVGLPEVERLLDEGRSCAAFRLVARVARDLPDDPEIARVRQNWMRRATFRTDPPGADVYVTDYVDAAPGAREDYLGTTPLEAVLVPAGHLRYRISKPGLTTAEGSTGSAVTGGVGDPVRVRLYAEGTAPPGMVRVLAPDPVGEFWLDRYEVTNRQFEAFVAHGGYEKPDCWRAPFVEGGRAIGWEQAMALFTDATGRPGPAAWEHGTFPKGQEDYPVRGLSWHEAAAYCAFEGKSLPTVHHWRAASRLSAYATILSTSNFSGRGPARVGRYQGLGPFGTYDQAGNVREWCLNASGDRRYILGGAWNDPKYLFYLPDARLPLDRSDGNGFRCARYDSAPSPALTRPLDYSPLAGRPPGEPASDPVFQAYKALHSYQHGELDARVEAVDDTSPYWRTEKVSFRAGYGNERVTAYLFLPKNAEPPFQTVVTFPGAYAFDIRESRRLETQWFDFIVRSGRAVMHPIYKGMYERTIGGDWVTYQSQPAVYRDLAIQWYKDLARSLDYLQARPEIDPGRLGYQGISVGAVAGPRFMALEPRFKVALLFWGGLGWGAAEINPLNFAGRSTVPTLMVNGRADPICPLVSSQVPMFRLLGAPDADKRHVVVEDAGHVAFNHEVVRQALAWLDRYLGPVQSRPTPDR